MRLSPTLGVTLTLALLSFGCRDKHNRTSTSPQGSSSERAGGTTSNGQVASGDEDPSSSRKRMGRIESWGYQLQGTKGKPVDLDAIAQSPYELVVVDYANNGSELSADEVARLQRMPSGTRRVVLAYLSIGEAEDYRFYWDKEWSFKKPAFVDAVNKDWAGNFKVKYWDPAWQKILFGRESGDDKSYLDRIVDAGFDGVYLDIVDGFQYFLEEEHGARKSAPLEMAALVSRIGRYARTTKERPGFLVVPQNGVDILLHLGDEAKKNYLDAIDGIGTEDTFFYGSRDMNNSLKVQSYSLKFLKEFQASGKKIFSIEYINKSPLLREYEALVAEHGFVPYAGPRALDRLSPPLANQ